jgi:hypothetical protein
VEGTEKPSHYYLKSATIVLKKLKLCSTMKINHCDRVPLVWKDKRKRIKGCVCNVAVGGSETGTVGKMERGL